MDLFCLYYFVSQTWSQYNVTLRYIPETLDDILYASSYNLYVCLVQLHVCCVILLPVKVS